MFNTLAPPAARSRDHFLFTTFIDCAHYISWLQTRTWKLKGSQMDFFILYPKNRQRVRHPLNVLRHTLTYFLDQINSKNTCMIYTEGKEAALKRVWSVFGMSVHTSINPLLRVLWQQVFDPISRKHCPLLVKRRIAFQWMYWWFFQTLANYILLIFNFDLNTCLSVGF